MKKIRTLQDLTDRLDDDLVWRKREISTLKFLHDRARGHEKTALRRAGIALLYAHFEGYFKAAGTSYAEYVSRQNLRYRDLVPGFLALSVRAKLSQVADSARGQLLSQIAAFFVESMDEPVRLSWENAVKTKSNLGSERLKDIFAFLALDYQYFEIREKTVIEHLLVHRNSIAHGKPLLVEDDDFERLTKEVTGMLDKFRDILEDSAQAQSFLRAGVGDVEPNSSGAFRDESEL